MDQFVKTLLVYTVGIQPLRRLGVKSFVFLNVLLLANCGNQNQQNSRSDRKPAENSKQKKNPKNGENFEAEKKDDSDKKRIEDPKDTQGIITDVLLKTTASEKIYKGGGVSGSNAENYVSEGGVSSEYLINAPAANNASTPHGVLIYLHGDGAGDYRGYWSGLQKVAAKRGLIAMSVLSPRHNSWYKDGKNHGEFLDSLLRKEIFVKYNILLSKIVFTGASGGPQFLTGQFIPQYGNNYPYALALPICGGGGTVGYQGWIQKLKPNDEFKKYFRVHYHTGSSDFLYRDAKSSYEFYQKQGVKNVKFDNIVGNGHCKFNQGVVGVADELMGQYF